MYQHIVHARRLTHAGMRAARDNVRKHQEAHLVATVAGHNDVLRKRRERGDASDTQRADTDPGAGVELEVFCNTTVEKQAALRPPGVRELHGVADEIKSL